MFFSFFFPHPNYTPVCEQHECDERRRGYDVVRSGDNTAAAAVGAYGVDALYVIRMYILIS